MAASMLSGASAGTVKFDDMYSAALDGPEKELIAKEIVKTDGGMAMNYSTQVWFELSDFGLLSALSKIVLEVPNATFATVAGKQLYLFTDNDGVVDTTNTKVLGLVSEGGFGSNFVKFDYTGEGTNLNGQKAVLGYDDDGTVDATNTIFGTELVLTTAVAKSLGFVQVNVKQILDATGAEVFNNGGKPTANDAAVFAQVVKQLDNVAKPAALKGSDTIDVAQGRKYFDEYAFDDTSNGMGLQTVGTVPSLGYGVTAGMIDKVTITIKSSSFQAIKSTPKAKAITIKTDDNVTIVGNPAGDNATAKNTFTLEVLDDDNITAILNAKFLNFLIKVDAKSPVQVRGFNAGMAFDFAAEYGDTTFEPVSVGEWKVNCYQAVVPFMSTDVENFGTDIVVNNTASKAADVFFDVVSSDDATLDLGLYQNKQVASKKLVAAQGSLTVYADELKTALGLPASVKQFAVRVTVAAPVTNVTGIGFQKQGRGLAGRVIPLMTEGDQSLYLVQ